MAIRDVGLRQHQPGVLSPLRHLAERRARPVDPCASRLAVAAKLGGIGGQPGRHTARTDRVRGLAIEPKGPLARLRRQTRVREPPAGPAEFLEGIALVTIAQDRRELAPSPSPGARRSLGHAALGRP